MLPILSVVLLVPGRRPRTAVGLVALAVTGSVVALASRDLPHVFPAMHEPLATLFHGGTLLGRHDPHPGRPGGLRDRREAFDRWASPGDGRAGRDLCRADRDRGIARSTRAARDDAGDRGDDRRRAREAPPDPPGSRLRLHRTGDRGPGDDRPAGISGAPGRSASRGACASPPRADGRGAVGRALDRRRGVRGGLTRRGHGGRDQGHGVRAVPRRRTDHRRHRDRDAVIGARGASRDRSSSRGRVRGYGIRAPRADAAGARRHADGTPGRPGDPRDRFPSAGVPAGRRARDRADGRVRGPDAIR